MMWPRWSTNVVAVKAVVGEFLGRRTLVSSAILTTVAIWGGLRLRIEGYAHTAAVSVFLATAGTVSSIAWTWVLSTRWCTLILLPVKIKDLTRAVYLVGMFVAFIEAIAPATVFIAISFGISRVSVIVIPLICIGLGSAPVIILFWSGASRHHQIIAGTALALILGASVRMRPDDGAIIAFFAATLCIVLAPEVGRDSTDQHRRRRLVTSQLVLGELLRSSMAQINSLVLIGVGIAINVMLDHHGTPVLIGFILAVSNTPLNSYFSRHPSTWLVIRTCPRAWLSYWHFGAQLALCNVIGAAVVTLAPGWSATRTPGNLTVAVIAAIAAAATAATMEMHWPLTDWKSEREVLRHPRKYVPGVMAFIAAGCGWSLIAS